MQFKTKLFIRLAAPTCLLLGLSFGPAQAQPTSAQTSAIRASCRSDFMANCSGVTPGGKDALECLQRNVAKLSSSCKAAVSATMPAAPAAAAPERPAAVAAPPPPPPPPPAAAPRPAPAQAAPPPPPERAAPMMAPAPHPAAMEGKPTPAQTSAIRQYCRSDFMSHCQGVTPGGEEALTCLKRHVAALSPPCKAAVASTIPAPAGAPHPMNAPAAALPPAPAVAPLNVRPFILPQRRLVISAICHADAERLCPGIPPIGGRLFDCLAAQAASLAPSCYDALARVSR
jgi:hypothetical protein